MEQKRMKHATSWLSSLSTITSCPTAGMARMRPRGRANFQSDRPVVPAASLSALAVDVEVEGVSVKGVAGLVWVH